MAQLKREIETVIESHLSRSDSNILLVEGARQVGKTTSIRNVGKRLFKHFVEINLFDDSRKERIFKDVKTVSDFHLQLSSRWGKELGKREDTLIFLDEIQVYPDLFPLLKFLNEEKRYRYICSGSALGVELRRRKDDNDDEEDAPLPYIPMGAVSLLRMYPLSFKEFLMANGYGKEALDDMRKRYDEGRPLSQVNHNRMMDLFRRYLIVGGLPEPVSVYLDTQNVYGVRSVQRVIRRFYAEDASQYGKRNSLAIKEAYDYLPSTMQKEKKRVIFRDIEGNKRASADTYRDEFDYLDASGIALPCRAIASPSYPLGQVKKKNLSKFYLNDVGLLSLALLGDDISPIVGDSKSIDMGSIYETFVAEELSSRDIELSYYDSKKLGEVDFLIDDPKSHSVLPIEVKSGKDYKIHRAMDNLLKVEEYHIEKGIVLSNDIKVETEGRVIYLPIYYAMFIGEIPFLKEQTFQPIEPYELDA